MAVGILIGLVVGGSVGTVTAALVMASRAQREMERWPPPEAFDPGQIQIMED